MSGEWSEAMATAFEQQPRESAKAFEAFSVYLNMGAERSLAAVGRKLGKSRALLERWSAKFDWAGRVQAQAAYLAVVEREATEAVARGRSAEWLKRQQEVREREWDMHEKCIAAAKRALAAFMEREKVYANLADISRMLEVASKLGRLATGMATDRTESSVEVEGKLDVEWEVALRKVYGNGQGGKAEMLKPEMLKLGNGNQESVVDVEAKEAGEEQKRICE